MEESSSLDVFSSDINIEEEPTFFLDKHKYLKIIIKIFVGIILFISASMFLLIIIFVIPNLSNPGIGFALPGLFMFVHPLIYFIGAISSLTLSFNVKEGSSRNFLQLLGILSLIFSVFSWVSLTSMSNVEKNRIQIYYPNRNNYQFLASYRLKDSKYLLRK